ncbi:hypothetical protein BJ742DRAFT_786972 [Cladochytrium replicatum]|nr:hypothetical protein BJ742DRAFT_786972 [Cladochytrium replicatum]
MGRKNRVSYYYHPDIGNYHYAPQHPMKPHRIRLTHNLIVNYGMYKNLEFCRPTPATALEMTKFHSDDYIEFLQRITPANTDELSKQQQKYNVGEDCPVFDGLFEFCSLSAGGSISSAIKLGRGATDIAINWGGGLHHAKKSEASGFCYVNDIVLGILELLRYYPRVLYVDTDIHHGDGVEEAFYCTDRVMTLSFHKYGEFFPGTGALTDIGAGKGRQYSVNVPLQDGLDDTTFRDLVSTVLGHVLEWYRPDAVVLQCGADSLSGDRLGCFNLSMKGHSYSLEFLKKKNIPILLLGGGGYTIQNVARTWCYETAVAADIEVSEDIPSCDYHEYFGPDYKLDVPSSNMENLNSKQYIEKIKIAILENLRSLPHAPGVQLHSVPADQDFVTEADENPDVRMSQSARDAYRVPENSYSDSEDDEPADVRRDRRSHKHEMMEEDKPILTREEIKHIKLEHFEEENRAISRV